MNEGKVKDWIVKILRSKTAERAEGTGFWAGPEGYVLTCWHVVEQIEKPWVEYKGKKDYIEEVWHIGDIALLRVKKLKGPPALLDLQSNREVGNKIYSLGFQYEGEQGEMALGYFPVGEGVIKGDAETDGYESIVLEGAVHVERGASGAPALNRETGKVIGLIGAKWPHQDWRKECEFVLPLSLVDSEIEPWRLLRPRFQAVGYRFGQEDIFRFYEETFVGREAEIGKVRSFVSSGEGGYLVFQGKTGMGKSALVAELARQAAGGNLHEQLSCLVYFIRQEGKRHTPEAFSGSLNHQLLQLLAKNEEVPLPLPEKERQYDRLWEEVKGTVASHNRLLVLIDGWDEAAWGGEQPLAQYLPSVIPPYLSWVLTSRPLPEVRQSLPSTHPLRSLDAAEVSGLGPEGMRQLLHRAGDKVPRNEAFITRLVATTRGEPLFLRFLCEDIANWGEEAERHWEEIPQEVEEYFVRQFDQLRERAQQSRDEDLSFDILKTLLVAYSGMTAQELAGVLGVGLQRINRSLETIKRFLLGQERFELMHLEFRRTLDKELARQAEKEAALERLITYCAEHWAKKIPEEEYPARFYLRHLFELERYTEMLEACQKGYLEAKLERLFSPEWLEEDYTLLYQACEKLDNLAALLRWGEARAQIADEVEALRDIPGLPEAIGRIGQAWDRALWDKEMGLCALMPSREGKITAYLLMGHGVQTGAKKAPKEIFERVRALLKEMSQGRLKDDLAAKYTKALCRWEEPYLLEALEVSKQITDEWHRAEALVAVAQGYAQLKDQEAAARVLPNALEAAEQVDDAWHRAEVLTAVAQGYAQLGNQELVIRVLQQAREAAEQVEYERHRAEVLAVVAQGFAQIDNQEMAIRGLRKVLEAAGQIKDEKDQAHVLVVVAQSYAQLGNQELAIRLLRQAREAAEQVKYERHRAEVLAVVAQGFAQIDNQEPAVRVLRQALEAAGQTKHYIWDGNQAEMLVVVAQGYAKIANHELAVSGLSEIMEAAGQIHLGVHRAEVLAAVAHGYIQFGNQKAADQLFRQALEAEWPMVAWVHRVRVLAAVAQGYAQLRDHELATRGLRQTLKAAGQMDFEWHQVRILVAMAKGYANLRDQELAIRGLSHVLEMVGQIKSQEDQARVLAAVAQGYGRLRDQEQAARGLRQTLEAATQVPLRAGKRAEALAAVAQGYAQLKDQKLVVQGLERTLDEGEQIRFEEDQFPVVAAVAQGYAQLTSVSQGEAQLDARVHAKFVLRDAMRVVEQYKVKDVQGLLAMAQAYAQLGDQEAAARVLGQALSAVRRPQDYELADRDYEELDRVLAAVARGYAQLGDQELAVQGLNKTLEAVCQKDLEWGLAAVADGYTQLRDRRLATVSLRQLLKFSNVLNYGWLQVEALAALGQGYAQLSDQEAAARVLGQALEAVGQIEDERRRGRALAAVALGYAKLKEAKADDLLAIIPVNGRFIKGCQVVMAASSEMTGESEMTSVSRLPYRFFPLASRRSRRVYYQVIEAAIPYLMPEHLPPVLRFLEERFLP